MVFRVFRIDDCLRLSSGEGMTQLKYDSKETGAKQGSEQLQQTRIPDPKLGKTISKAITVIIPTLNEEKTIAQLIRELHNASFSHIVIIDGNSTDCTAEIAGELGATVLSQNGKGKGNALKQAFNHKELNDWVVIIDADGSMNPEEIMSFLVELGNGTDVVKGSRFLPEAYSEDMTLLRRIGNKFFISLVNLLWDCGYSDLCYGYAAFKKEALVKMYPLLKSKNFEIETEMFIKAKKLGYKIKEVPSVELKRKFGKSNLNALIDGFRILKTILREAIHD
jgi:glycosyltransferase involved in cell wall biosynthesis